MRSTLLRLVWCIRSPPTRRREKRRWSGCHQSVRWFNRYFPTLFGPFGVGNVLFRGIQSPSGIPVPPFLHCSTRRAMPPPSSPRSTGVHRCARPVSAVVRPPSVALGQRGGHIHLAPGERARASDVQEPRRLSSHPGCLDCLFTHHLDA